MALELWLPESAREETRKRRCNNCGREWPWRQRRNWEQHVVKCIKRHPERVEQKAHERDANYVTGVADRELHDWIRRNPGLNP